MDWYFGVGLLLMHLTVWREYSSITFLPWEKSTRLTWLLNLMH